MVGSYHYLFLKYIKIFLQKLMGVIKTQTGKVSKTFPVFLVNKLLNQHCFQKITLIKLNFN